MVMDYKIINVRLQPKTVEQLENFKWTSNKSEAIRLILDSFFSMSPEEQTAFLKEAAEKKFS